jgi:hypothetical protein
MKPIEIPRLKEEYIKSKYKPKETVIEVREDDGSKYCHSKQTSIVNNFLSIDEQKRKQPSMTDNSFDVKKIDFNDESNEKNIIIDKLDDPSILSEKKTEVIEEKDEEDNNGEKDEENEDNDSLYDSDLSDTSIMLVDIRPKQDFFKDKVPKLSFIPQTFEGFKENKPEIKLPINIPSKPVETEKNIDNSKPIEKISEKVIEKIIIQEEKKEEKIDSKINLLPLNLNKISSDRKIVIPSLGPLNKSLNNSNTILNPGQEEKSTISLNKKSEDEKPIIKKRKIIIN